MTQQRMLYFIEFGFNDKAYLCYSKETALSIVERELQPLMEEGDEVWEVRLPRDVFAYALRGEHETDTLAKIELITVS